MNDQRPVRAGVAVARSAVARSLSSLLYSGCCNKHCSETQIPHGRPDNQPDAHSLVFGSIDGSSLLGQSCSPHGLALNESQVAGSNPRNVKRVDLCLFAQLYSSTVCSRKDATSNDSHKRKR